MKAKGKGGLKKAVAYNISELSEANKLPAGIDAMLQTGCYPPIYDRALSPAWATSR